MIPDSFPFNFLRHPDPEKRRRRKIMVSVAIAHVLVIGGPFLIYAIIKFFEAPKPKVMQIKLVNPPPPGGEVGESQEKQEETPTPPTPTPPTPTPPTPTPPTPTPPTPVPPTPKPPTPKPPEPVPPPKPVEPKRVIPPTPVKPQPKQPEVKKTETKKTEEKKPEPPKYLTPDMIKRTNKVVKNQKTPSPAPPSNTTRKVDPNQWRKTLDEFGVPIGPPQPGKEALEASYGQRLGAYIRPRWNQPAKHELGGSLPEVVIRITMDSHGRVSSARIITPSNNTAMNNSVQKMLNALTMVPPPPAGINSIDIILAIENE